MSRSRKKHPIARNNDKDFKRFSNKRTRHDWKLSDGNGYRRNGFSWQIHDYISNWYRTAYGRLGLRALEDPKKRAEAYGK